MEHTIGLYVHIPFCVKKCPYCDFYSIVHDRTLEDAYTKAIVADMEGYKDMKMTANTLYFGGGTPILMSYDNMALIIKTAKEVFCLEGEVTLEANPNSTTKQKLAALKTAGINRISFGMQSANEKELKALGRLHDLPQAIEAVNNAYEAGIENISVDIMLGTPYQTMETVADTLDVITKLPISHISAYMLKVEESTPYYKSNILQYCADDDTLADIYLTTIRNLEENHFFQYEISNFAKKGMESQHNLKYWRCEEYFGFGASAHSFVGNRRYYNENSVQNYIVAKGADSITTDENAGGIDEYVMLGLRLSEGIHLDKIKNDSSVNFKGFMLAAKRFCDCGYAQIADEKLSLSKAGYLLSNQIITGLLQNVI
ncbi:MAG: radical SAM family heme chaperone HemW [Oscillospiraceae bacterium]